MSKTIISVERVDEVQHHPNADRLDVVQILGYKVITGRDEFKVGDSVFYFPPDILLPPDQVEVLGVGNYLKHAIFPDDIEKSKCRVGAARLRGVPSHGFCAPRDIKHPLMDVSFGLDVTCWFNAHKYEPPVRLGGGDSLPELETFHKYTEIEHIQRYPDAIPEGTDVVITEKIHGTNCRMGYVWDGNEHIFVAGSHKIRRKEGVSSGTTTSLYWHFLTEQLRDMLGNMSDQSEGASIVLFGEIFGPGIQDLKYGQPEKAFRVFDISVDGVYMDALDMELHCLSAGLQTVPQLYVGPFSQEIVEEHTYGNTTFGGVTGKFKGREGCVIKPVVEQHSDVLGGRMILKSISVDYRDRKGAKDIE